MKKIVTVAAITMGVAVLAYTQIKQPPSTENHATQASSNSAKSASADIKLAHTDPNDAVDDLMQTDDNLSDNNGAADKTQDPETNGNNSEEDGLQTDEDTDGPSMSDGDDNGSGDDAGSMDTDDDGDDDGDDEDDSEDANTMIQPS